MACSVILGSSTKAAPLTMGKPEVVHAQPLPAAPATDYPVSEVPDDGTSDSPDGSGTDGDGEKWGYLAAGTLLGGLATWWFTRPKPSVAIERESNPAHPSRGRNR